MAEMTGWRQGSQKPMMGLFYLASELDGSEEATRRRQEEKRQILLSAGVLLPTIGSWDDRGAAISLMAGTCDGDGPCQSYVCPAGTSPQGANTGNTGRS
jgi:hypothetical protein